MKVKQTNVERFYEWMKAMNNKFLHDHNQMTSAFHIVAMQDVNELEVVEPVIVNPN